MKVHRLFFVIGIAAALTSGCVSESPEEPVFVPLFVTPEAPVSHEKFGEISDFQVGFGYPLSDQAVVTATSSDETRATVSFPTGSSALYQASGAIVPCQTASVTCVETESEEPAVVTINFTVTSTMDMIAPMNAARQITCPGKTGQSPVNPNIPVTPIIPKGNITVAPVTGLTTAEDGKTDTFTIKLNRQPASDVTIALQSANPKEGTVTPATAVFTSETWNTAQTFTVTGVDDSIKDGDVIYSILIGPAQSLDPQFNQHTIPSVTVTNADDDRFKDKANILISASELKLLEGGAKDISMHLAAEPKTDVTIEFKAKNGRVTFNPEKLTFMQNVYSTPQTVNVSAPRDNLDSAAVLDDTISIAVTSTDERYNNFQLPDIPVTIRDTGIGSGEVFTIRAMAANISSGSYQSYDPEHGIRIFQAVKPDIVMIQEFNYAHNSSSDIRRMVDTAFGPEYDYSRGRDLPGGIPNGIISKYPIINSGYWKSNKVPNRDWDWALIDIPGKKELLAVSLHLHTSDNGQEIPSLVSRMKTKINEDKALGTDYYILVGGDFNAVTAAKGKTPLSDVVFTSIYKRMPVDQNGLEMTNASRKKVLDLLFADKELHFLETPAEIGRHSYEFGHVFDSRVYEKRGELQDVPPVRGGDSSATNMQHMAVIRDFTITGK